MGTLAICLLCFLKLEQRVLEEESSHRILRKERKRKKETNFYKLAKMMAEEDHSNVASNGPPKVPTNVTPKASDEENIYKLAKNLAGEPPKTPRRAPPKVSPKLPEVVEAPKEEEKEEEEEEGSVYSLEERKERNSFLSDFLEKAPKVPVIMKDGVSLTKRFSS